MTSKSATPRCHFCRRPLTAPRSVALGVGPECAEKRASAIGGIGTSEAEIAEIEKHDPRRARLILCALGKGTRRDATLFLSQARKFMAAPMAAQ